MKWASLTHYQKAPVRIRLRIGEVVDILSMLKDHAKSLDLKAVSYCGTKRYEETADKCRELTRIIEKQLPKYKSR